MSASLPLLTLQPVSDVRNAWAALLLDATPACDGAALQRLFDELGLAAALGPLPCVVPLTDLCVAVDALPAEQIVLRLPATLCCDRGNDAALTALAARGFRLMSTGVPLPGQTLCEGVDALAVPCTGWKMAVGLADWLGKLKGPHLALEANDMTCPGKCQFQWLARHFSDQIKPALPGKGGEAPNRLLLLELLAQVANDADSHTIEATIKRDPQLSYHLLKLVNSVAFSLTTKIGSFSQAITLLGRRQLQRWLQLLLYARTQNNELSNPLLPRAALRAGLTEALCARAGGNQDAQDRAFMVGMFSLLGVLFGMPLTELVKPLNLTDDVLGALLERSGPLGWLLNAAEAAERAPDAALAAVLADAGVDNDAWARCLVHASAWAIQISREA